MRIRHTRLQLIGVISVVAILITVVIIGYYRGLLNDFSNTGASLQTNLNNRISMSTCFLESMTEYGMKFFKNDGIGSDSEYFWFLRYDSASDSYSMDSMEGTIYEKLIGNLTGKGRIPQSGVDKEELNMALCLNDYFSHFSTRMPEIAWIYYTSEKGFIVMYPWVASRNFKYSDNLKDVAFYSAATPEKNPSRKPVWTPVYLDAAGKGLMITLSSPIYYGEVFKGVLSLDFTTGALSRMLQSEYDCYLVGEDYSVITSGNLSGDNIGIVTLNELLKMSDGDFQSLKNARCDEVRTAGKNLIYKAKISETPFTLIMVVSKAKIFWKAMYLSLPGILIGTLLIITFVVIGNLRKVEEKLRNTMLIDPLTGLKNRRYLDGAIGDELSRADRNQERLSIASMDLDHFKRVNDTWGHPVGDEVLKLTANAVKSSIRESDVMIRLGGEEFLILMPQTDIDAALIVAERARKAIEEMYHPIAGRITASFGVIERQPDESYISMFRRVDEALYSAKEAGRNCVRRYEEKKAPSVTLKLTWNRAWECGEMTIDAQHREITNLGNKLMGMVSAPSEETERKLDEIMEHFSAHFEYEERVIKEIGYPEFERHAETHRKLIEKLSGIRESAKSGRIRISVLFSFIMDDVIVGHLLEEDMKFFPYLKK